MDTLALALTCLAFESIKLVDSLGYDSARLELPVPQSIGKVIDPESSNTAKLIPYALSQVRRDFSPTRGSLFQP
jgi:hypothetical protein